MADTLILSHGAGSNRNAPLLVALDTAFTERGVRVVRIDLPYRERRPHGPPFPGEAAADRAAIRAHAAGARAAGEGRVFVGGHSYGGRQSTMAAAEEPGLIDALLLLSYPLHPPRKTERRTAHFPTLQTPALFVHGSRDPFGSIEELQESMALIPARTMLLPCEGAGHDLNTKKKDPATALATQIAEAFLEFAG